jgi:hypothetical protein
MIMMALCFRGHVDAIALLAMGDPLIPAFTEEKSSGMMKTSLMPMRLAVFYPAENMMAILKSSTGVVMMALPVTRFLCPLRCLSFSISTYLVVASKS